MASFKIFLANFTLSQLPELAQEQKASQIVIGTQERSALSRAILGSVSNDLAHRSSVPVTVVPFKGVTGSELKTRPRSNSN